MLTPRANDIKFKKSIPIEWAREIGVKANSGEFDPVKEYTQPNENDVYPLSIHFTKC